MLLFNPISDAEPLLDRADRKEQQAGESEDVKFPPVKPQIEKAVVKENPGIKDCKHGAAHMKPLCQCICTENYPCKHHQHKGAQTLPEFPHQRIPEDSSRVEKALPEGICQCSDDLVCAMKKAPEYKVNSISVPDPAHQKGKQ